MINHSTLAIVAIVAALGLVGVVAIESIISIIPQHQAKAAGPGFPGCANTPGGNASQGRCLHIGHP